MSDKKSKQTAEIINPGLGDIEKVRDILFGKYVADFQQRFAELEERLEDDVEELKQRLSDKIDSMDDEVNRSLERLDQQILHEQNNRDNELNSLQKSFNDAETSLKHSINLLEDQANQDLNSVRLSLEESHQELIDASQAAQRQLGDQLEKQKAYLENDKVGRQSLALLLDEVAIKLRGNDS